MNAHPDPITTEIIRNAFVSCAEDMNASLIRSAYTPIIYEGKDCAVAILDEDTAVLGQSLGGQEAVFGMLFEPRFRAGVVSCGFSLVRLLVERSISHNMALYLPGMLPDLDFDTLVPALAPRPLYVLAGRQDAIYPLDGVEAVEARARLAYRDAGAGDRLRFHYFDEPHTLPSEALGSALAWLGEVLA